MTISVQDASQRQRIRQNQRDQMRHSELCDGESLARALEHSVEQMLARWRHTRVWF
ncbi:hypothetical protein [Thiorhodovibrio frisius]|uniref:hypothetical protein n=1 Tax=Thiorhodovibrio frisius TaxID=631362 RepID=UPI00167F4115|nr:hypothetical protein [Thiorhodovibrio frisius]